MMYFTISSLIVLSLFTYTTFSQTVIKSVTLTPNFKADSGARLITNVGEVKTFNGIWDVLVLSQSGWQFILSLDGTFGFDPVLPSAISITMDATSISTNELLFGFTTDNDQYIAVSLPMDNIGRSNRIFPSCHPAQSAQAAASFSAGDIASIPNFDRDCDIAGGSCLYWANMIPPNHASGTQMPVTFILEHDPSDATLTIFVEDASLSSKLQSCSFASGFKIDQGLKLYVAGNNPGETYSISSFDIRSYVRDPTVAPTPEPSTSPTSNPLLSPTITPTVATLKPTPNTANPTNPPTLTTLAPNANPSVSPTAGPSSNPTTIAPSGPPSAVPTTTPSAAPSTARPTLEAPPAGYVWGAYDQLCQESVATTGLCRDVVDFVSLSSVLCLQPYDCCMCDYIECGVDGIPCVELRVGAFGALGVQDIRVSGDVNGINGAALACEGRQSCRETTITADNVNFIDCDGKKACQNSTILITDPKPEFSFDCAGKKACNNLNIEIYFSAPPPGEECGATKEQFLIPKISCNDQFACEGANITINNQGCDAVVIENLECIQPNACNDATFNLIGDVVIDNCLCGPSCTNTIGLSQCFENLERVLCPDAHSCAEQKKTITNPRNGFEFICSDVQSCEAAEFVIVINEAAAEPVYSFSKILLGGLNSARNMVFTVDNQQASDMTIEIIECGGDGSCADATFVIGNNVFIEAIKCAADSCVGCMIKRELLGPGIPCDASDIRPLLQNLQASYV